MCLQIGAEKHGLSGWFRKEDVAFGDAVNRVICDFPSYDRDLFVDAKTLGEAIPGVESKENLQAADVWLIGTLPDGSWLVEVNGEEVVRAEKDIFFGISLRNTKNNTTALLDAVPFLLFDRYPVGVYNERRRKPGKKNQRCLWKIKFAHAA